MEKNAKQPLIIIAGPTASGKSALGVELAKRLNGEIISADSMQVYRGMDIGTAKVTTEEMQGIPHHMIGVAEPAVKKAVSVTKRGRIGLIGTAATIRSGKYQILIKELLPEAEIFGEACPLFVPLAEAGRINRGDIVILAPKYHEKTTVWQKIVIKITEAMPHAKGKDTCFRTTVQFHVQSHSFCTIICLLICIITV